MRTAHGTLAADAETRAGGGLIGSTSSVGALGTPNHTCKVASFHPPRCILHRATPRSACTAQADRLAEDAHWANHRKMTGFVFPEQK